MKQILFLACVVFFYSSDLAAQTLDTSKVYDLGEKTVTAYREESIRETSLNITRLNMDSLRRFGNFNLTDMMARVPGVSMLTTGVAIAKPVIRGLYGNRTVILLNGLKFDNQQWQEEHGLGLSEVGLSRVEIIKGPLSVLYGSEAIGGVINIVDEQRPTVGTREGDFSMKFNTNTLGGLVQGGYKVNNGKKWFSIRVGVENNADYSDGKNQRVLNSRFDAYYLKSSFGFVHKHGISTFNLSSSFNRFGFIFADAYTFIVPDARWSRDLGTNPAHLVVLNILSNENKFNLKDGSKLSFNVGLQVNQRMEKEGGGGISLNMLLITGQYLLKWEKKLSEKNRIVLSNLGSIESNKNLGARKLIPDAFMQESNVSFYLETNFKGKVILENGVGVGEKFITTYSTLTVNTPDKEIQPFSKFSFYYNGFTGISIIPSKNFNIKLNAATGVRVANLAELSSDGLHEGTYTFEIGNPKLKNEQNICVNLYAEYSNKILQVWGSPFYNHFFNYIYLAPTAEQWFGFPVYRYKQQDADQYGGEFGFTFKPIKTFSIGGNYSGMISKTADGYSTPYVPAQKISPIANVNFSMFKRVAVKIYGNVDYCMAQPNTAPFEIGSNSYWLLNAGLSTNFHVNNASFDLSITGSNLLNTSYYDNLSRFKNYGLLNIGRNIVIMLKVKFTSAAGKK